MRFIPRLARDRSEMVEKFVDTLWQDDIRPLGEQIADPEACVPGYPNGRTREEMTAHVKSVLDMHNAFRDR